MYLLVDTRWVDLVERDRLHCTKSTICHAVYQRLVHSHSCEVEGCMFLHGPVSSSVFFVKIVRQTCSPSAVCITDTSRSRLPFRDKFHAPPAVGTACAVSWTTGVIFTKLSCTAVRRRDFMLCFVSLTSTCGFVFSPLPLAPAAQTLRLTAATGIPRAPTRTALPRAEAISLIVVLSSALESAGVIKSKTAAQTAEQSTSGTPQ